MNTKLSLKSSEQGTALLVALFLTTILAVTIAGYLKHAYQQHYISMRSQVWNSSIAVSEAGIEEALQHLNTNPTNLTANGWAQSGSTYSMSRTLSSSARYQVTIDAANLIRPEITSVAYLSPPVLAQSASQSMLAAAIGGETIVVNKNDIVSRAVHVKAGKDGIFMRAMVAKHWIDMNGNNIRTDSFNSTTPTYSDNGMYPADKWWKIRDNGDVASNDNIKNTINVGNANIFGSVSVGPGGTVALGPSGGVGTRTWQAGNPGTIQPGYFFDNMNFTFPTIGLPYNTGLTPTPGSISTTNYTFASTTNTITSTNYPWPAPASGVTSNMSYVTTSTPMSPTPFGTITNVLTDRTDADTFPAPGTYVGTPTKLGSKWRYYRITGYTYTYPIYSFTYSTELVTTNYIVNTVDYDYVLQGSETGMPPLDYYVTDIPNGKVYVTGNARLVVRNNYKQAANDGLWIATDGKLEMWVGGTSIDLSGNGVINDNGFAQNFILWGTDSVQDLKYAGNGEFTGIIVAPNADVKLSGGGSGPEDFIGSLLANTITMNGHYSFHYDEALRDLDKNGRYKVTEWNEVTLTQAAIVSP